MRVGVRGRGRLGAGVRVRVRDRVLESTPARKVVCRTKATWRGVITA